MASPLTVAATAEGPTSQWTANTGTKVAAVASPNDDITTHINSGSSINQVQQFTGNVSSIPLNSIVTQVQIYYRHRRGGLIDADFVVGYTSGVNSGVSSAITSTSSWAGATWSHTGLSFLWGGSFIFYCTNTQARSVLVSTLYAVITYFEPLTIKTMYYARRRG